MINIITSQYFSSQAGATGSAAASASATQVSTAITAASRMVESYCARSFYARRYATERYDAISQHSLSLRHAPLVQLNQVTIFPDDPSPLTYQPASFDIDYRRARLTFKYNANGTFFTRLYNAGPFGQAREGIIEVDYFCGYGFITVLASTVNVGGTSLSLLATAGRVSGQEPWQISSGGDVVLDPGLPSEEVVTLTATATAGEYSCTPTVYSHAPGSFVSGSNTPSDVQLATALLAGNLLNLGDLTKQQEMLGRLGGYVYTQRSGNALLTPEITAILAPYREICL